MNAMLRKGLMAGLVALGLGAGLGVGSGCATAVPEIDAELTADNRAIVDGDVVPLARLPARLRSAGARPETLIRIRFAPGDGQPPFGEVSRLLQSSGYPKFFFVGPRQARSGAVGAAPVGR